MIRNLVFDIGGVIIDDGNGSLARVLNLSPGKMSVLKGLLYNNPRWSEGVMLGKITQHNYMLEMIKKYPEWAEEIKKCLSSEFQPEIVPILTNNLQYILSLKPKYSVYLLSNLTDETYNFLEDIITEFDGGAFSFQEHLKKPDLKFYQVLFRRYGLNPEECIFFDDRAQNLEAGEKLGMRGVLVHSLDDIKSAFLT